EARFTQVRELVNKFLFDIDRSIRDLPGSTKPRAMLVSTALKYLDNLSADPSADDNLLRELGMAYLKIGDTQRGSQWASLGDSGVPLPAMQRRHRSSSDWHCCILMIPKSPMMGFRQ